MKPRVASFYESRLGRNDGNPLYVTHVLQRDYADTLEFHHLLPDPALQLQQIGRFDLHLWIDWGEDGLTGLLPYVPIACPSPSVYWASDTHLGFAYRLQKAREMTHVFVAQQPAVTAFAAEGVPAIWLPHAVEPQAYNPAGTFAATREAVQQAETIYRLKKWDVCFVGHLNTPLRVAFLDRMFRAFPNAWFASRRTGRSFERAADIFTQTRVVLNEAVNDDLNMRVFEVLATRSCLLTPRVTGLDTLFQDGTHLVTYRTTEEALDKAADLLAHEADREAIAEAGYRLVHRQHTIAHRVRTMLTAARLPAMAEVA